MIVSGMMSDPVSAIMISETVARGEIASVVTKRIPESIITGVIIVIPELARVTVVIVSVVPDTVSSVAVVTDPVATIAVSVDDTIVFVVHV
jgi:hypothetical protein